MSGRGGNQRPLTSPDGRDLQYARLLFDALWSKTSKSGRRFAKDQDLLYRRWLRLARVIIRNNGGATPFGSIGDTDRVLDLLELPDDRNSGYPSLRDLNEEELASLKWQRAIATEALDEIYIDLGQPLDQRDALASERESWKIYDDASSFLFRWGNQPAYDANPNIKRKRWRRREIIVSYRREVAAFCKRWRLKAWWAVPAIIQHHFLRAENGSAWDRTIPPLSMYVLEPSTPVALPVTVKLPDRSEKQFERDKTTVLNLSETTVIQTVGGPIRVIRHQFSREERAEWERSNDSSCVLLEWDGRRHILQNNDIWPDSPTLVTPGEFLVERCEYRLGRNLKTREKRDVLRQCWEQIREHRIRLGAEGWAALSDGNLDLIATSVARLLLSPSVTWDALTPVDERGSGKNRYRDAPSIQRACNTFSALANLELPAKRTGRGKGSHNAYDPAHR